MRLNHRRTELEARVYNPPTRTPTPTPTSASMSSMASMAASTPHLLYSAPTTLTRRLSSHSSPLSFFFHMKTCFVDQPRLLRYYCSPPLNKDDAARGISDDSSDGLDSSSLDFNQLDDEARCLAAEHALSLSR